MIPPFLIARFGKVGAKMALVGGVLALVGLVLLLSYCAGRGDGKRGEIVKQQEREIGVLEDVASANDEAADARVADNTRIMLEQRELQDALTETDDPDLRRALRGCIVLRQQGRDTAHIPACSRPAAGR